MTEQTHDDKIVIDKTTQRKRLMMVRNRCLIHPSHYCNGGHNLGSGGKKLQKFGPDIFLTIHFIVSISPSAELQRLHVSGLEE